MRAATYTRTGPAIEVLVLEDLLTPEPGAGEVRVQLAWSGVNPSDVKSRAGTRNKVLAYPKITPHSDGAGVIDKVGAGVDAARVGERVWVWNGAWGRASGTSAQFIVLPARQAVRLPDSTELDAGACLGIPALTALHAVQVDGGVQGQHVLVAGGAGAVGHYAVQMARLAGAAQVIATVSSPEKAALAVAAGAHAVINYRSEDVAKLCMELTKGRGVDRIIEVDLAANLTNDLAAVRPGGQIVIYGSGAAEIAVPFFPSILKNVTMRFFIVYNLSEEERALRLSQLTAMLTANQLSHNIAVRLPLEQIAEAHELVAQGRVSGNVVLQTN